MYVNGEFFLSSLMKWERMSKYIPWSDNWLYDYENIHMSVIAIVVVLNGTDVTFLYNNLDRVPRFGAYMGSTLTYNTVIGIRYHISAQTLSMVSMRGPFIYSIFLLFRIWILCIAFEMIIDVYIYFVHVCVYFVLIACTCCNYLKSRVLLPLLQILHLLVFCWVHVTFNDWP